MIWRKGWKKERSLGKTDALEKFMTIWFTPHQTTTLPKWMFFQKFSLNHPCCSLASGAFKYVPQTAATTFAFSSVCFFLLRLKPIGIRCLPYFRRCTPSATISTTGPRWLTRYRYTIRIIYFKTFWDTKSFHSKENGTNTVWWIPRGNDILCLN